MDTVEVRNWIGAEWTGEPRVVRVNPARADDTVARTAVADDSAIDQALAAAAAAQPGWARTPAPERGKVLNRAGAILESRIEQVASDLTREEGKTLTEARGEVSRAVSILRFFGGEGWRLGGETFPAPASDTLIYSRREPLGVVAAITPWNFPIAIPAWKSAPALVSGNAVVLKPAQLTPVSAWHLVSALVEAGTPPGIITLINGPGSALGAQLVDDPRVAAVSFTGSVATGTAIRERSHARHARVQLEMGGKNALVVLDDADPAAAARLAAIGGFGLTGQACTATSRVICTPGIRARFLDAFIAESERYTPGDGLRDGVLMGPVVSADQLATDRSFIDLARASGARIETRADNDRLLQPPVIVTDVAPKDRLAQEEVFGPVVAVLDAADLDTAIDIVNSTQYGLTAAIVTNDLAATHRFIRDAQAGVIKVNQTTGGVELNVPFGGVKASSTNTYREQGRAAIDFYTWTKSVYITPPTWA